MKKLSEQPFILLNSGLKMPQVGLGTFQCQDESLVDIIKEAISEVGYCHIDTAQLYGNEYLIGQALQDCFTKGIKREQLFITSKIWFSSRRKDQVEENLKNSLEMLGLEYLDIYLIHWCMSEVDFVNKKVKGPPIHETWRALEKCVEKGLVKHIGVSNCNVMLLVDILSYANIKPAINQVEFHPYFQQKSLADFCRKLDIQVVAHAPLGAPHGNYFPEIEQKYQNSLEDPIIKKLAEKHKRTPAQIILNWHLQQQNIIIPKTLTSSRLRENFECWQFTMEYEDYELIDKLDRNLRIYDVKYINELGFNKTPIFD